MGLVLALGLLVLALAVPCGFTAAILGLAAAPDLAAVVFGRPAEGFAVFADLAAVARLVVAADFVAMVDDLAAVLDLAAVVFGLAVLFGLAAVLDFIAVVFALAVVLALAAVLDLAPMLFGLAVLDLAVLATAIGFAEDIVLAAVVSDLAAVVMALVAVFIACMAVDIVLAEDVAFVAAAVILPAAEVTLVAADETVRAAEAADGAFMDALRVVLTAVALMLPLVFGRLAARLDALRLVDLVRTALAGLRRTAVRVVVRAGTDLPPC